MSTRVLIQDAPVKAQMLDRQGLVALRWLSWFDAIQRRCRAIYADASVDPPNLASGAAGQATMTVNGARVGDIATVSFDPLDAGIALMASVTATDTVTVTFFNVSGGAINLPAGTLRVRVEAWQ